jgi:apolipoprotein N-acyltransferase
MQTTHPSTLFDSLSRRVAWLVLFAAGGALSLVFAPFYFWPLLFLTLPLLYLGLRSAHSAWQAAWRAFFFGYGFFMAGTWWIGNALLVDAKTFGWMLPFSILGLSAAMAAWFLPLGYLAFRVRRFLSPLTFALLWTLIEVVRSVGMFGFPWNLLGYASLASLELAQLASVAGIFGLSFGVAWLALVPIYWLAGASWRRARTLLALLLLGMFYTIGQLQLSAPVLFTDTRLHLVQPNIPQEVKGTREGAALAAELLSAQMPGVDEPAPDVILWPETAYPYAIRAEAGTLLPGFQGTLITGAMRAEGQGAGLRLWNSLFAFSPSGNVLATYDKHQLVPFGEFVPLRSVLPLQKITPGAVDFSRGEGVATLSVEGIPPFSPQICYEGIFPWLAARRDPRPEWMLNVTNDAWYGMTAGPYQHFDMVRMRAIEQGLPMVRVANNGISAVIDGKGRVVAALPLGEAGAIRAQLPAAEVTTFYSRVMP